MTGPSHGFYYSPSGQRAMAVINGQPVYSQMINGQPAWQTQPSNAPSNWQKNIPGSPTFKITTPPDLSLGVVDRGGNAGAVAGVGLGPFSTSQIGGSQGVVNAPTAKGTAPPALTKDPQTWANRTTAEALRLQGQGQGRRTAAPTTPMTQPTSLNPTQVLEAEGAQPGGQGAAPTTSGVIPGVPGSFGAPGMSASSNQNAPSSPSGLGYAEGGVVDDGTEFNGGKGDLQSVQDRINQVFDFGRQKHGIPTGPSDEQRQQGKDMLRQKYMDKTLDLTPHAGPYDDTPTEAQKYRDAQSGKTTVGKLKSLESDMENNLASPAANQDHIAPPQPKNISYADGGVVNDQPNQQQSQQQGHSLGSYLMGTDAVSPDVASAAEQQIDPTGQMDPTERKMRAIAAQQDPNQAWGLMQAGRQKFDRYRAFARAAAQGVQSKPPDPAAAAHAATQAFENVPDGRSVQFTPSRDGKITATVKSLTSGASKTKRFEDGGVVDEDAAQRQVNDLNQGQSAELPENTPSPVATGDLSGTSGDDTTIGGWTLPLNAFMKWLAGPQSTHDAVMKNGLDASDIIKAGGTEGQTAGPEGVGTGEANMFKPTNPGQTAFSIDRTGNLVKGGANPTPPAAEQSTDGTLASSVDKVNRQTGSKFSVGNQDIPFRQAAAKAGEDENTDENTDETSPAGAQPTSGRQQITGQQPGGVTDEQLATWERQANRIYPMASMAGQRAAFIEQRIKAAEELTKAMNQRFNYGQVTAEGRVAAAGVNANQRAARDALMYNLKANENAIRARGQGLNAFAGMVRAKLMAGGNVADVIKEMKQNGLGDLIPRGMDVSQGQPQVQNEGAEDQGGGQPQIFRDKRTGLFWQKTPQGLIPYTQGQNAGVQ